MGKFKKFKSGFKPGKIKKYHPGKGK